MAFEVREVASITVMVGGTVAANRPQDFRKLRLSFSLLLIECSELSIAAPQISLKLPQLNFASSAFCDIAPWSGPTRRLSR
jgi:hypothetical protein